MSRTDAPEAASAELQEFHAPAPQREKLLDRATFAGVPPAEAARRLVEFNRSKVDLAASTAEQKQGVLERTLQDLWDKGLDVASVDAGSVAAYRAYLASLVESGATAQNYAAHVVKAWNSAMRCAFGEKGMAEEGLRMRTFRETPRRIDHWTEQEFLALVAAVPRLRYQNEHYRSLFATFLELDWCTSARLGSLRTEELTVGDVDWQNGVLRLHHVKNLERHDVVLTDRAIAQLRKHVEMLAATPQWKGEATPLFVSSRGEMVSHTFFHNKLKRAAAAAGVQKAIFPHAIRKSAGTLIARENPKLAQEQLGVTDRIFNRHYNQPLLEDRLARRDILPGAGGRRDASPEARVGKAFLDLQAGRISQGEFDAEIRRAQLHGADPKRTEADPSVA